MLSNIADDNEDYPKDSNKYFETMKPVKKGDQLNAPRKRHTFLSKTAHEFANVSTNVLEITTPGIAELFVGMLIKVNIPQPTQLIDDHMKFLLLYGQEATFLVTAIRHHYVTATDTYSTILSCSKESFGAAPAPKQFNNSPDE